METGRVKRASNKKRISKPQRRISANYSAPAIAIRRSVPTLCQRRRRSCVSTEESARASRTSNAVDDASKRKRRAVSRVFLTDSDGALVKMPRGNLTLKALLGNSPSFDSFDQKKVRKTRRKNLTRGPKAGDSLELSIRGLNQVFRYCPSGSFLMGSPETEIGRLIDETQHEVSLTHGFWMQETPVTQALWLKITGTNPSYCRGSAARPVEGVNWNDCVGFLSKLNAGGFAPRGWRFDFPTESEWEYACRAGADTSYAFGDEASHESGNFQHYVGETTPVKSYAPNAWGFYDMHGNVWEWCADLSCPYPTSPTVNPLGASENAFRVLRGGSWNCNASQSRSSSRNYAEASARSSDFGFRLVLRKTSAFNSFEKVVAVAPKPAVAATPAVAPSPLISYRLKNDIGAPINVKIGNEEVTFRYCPSGRTLIGSDELEPNRGYDEILHEVILTRGFWLMETPVTNSLWNEIELYNPNPWCACDDRPVANVSWEKCNDFIRKLNERELAPKGMTFSLPTESEWEYACRAGSCTPFSVGGSLENDDLNVVSYETFSRRRKIPNPPSVMSFEPNAWGLYDMHGCVWEWCVDWYDGYPTKTVSDPVGRALGRYRVIRGGSWKEPAVNCRSSSRACESPKKSRDDIGFRLALKSSD